MVERRRAFTAILNSQRRIRCAERGSLGRERANLSLHGLLVSSRLASPRLVSSRFAMVPRGSRLSPMTVGSARRKRETGLRNNSINKRV